MYVYIHIHIYNTYIHLRTYSHVCTQKSSIVLVYTP